VFSPKSFYHSESRAYKQTRRLICASSLALFNAKSNSDSKWSGKLKYYWGGKYSFEIIGCGADDDCTSVRRPPGLRPSLILKALLPNESFDSNFRVEIVLILHANLLLKI